MMHLKKLKYTIGDVLVPNEKNKTGFVREIVVDDVDPCSLKYGIVDLDGDIWQASSVMVEEKFMLKVGA